jgi:hypothetical protein
MSLGCQNLSVQKRIALPTSLQFFNGVHKASPTRRQISDIAASSFNSKLVGDWRSLPGTYTIHDQLDFLADMIKAMAARFKSPTPSISPLENWETSCKYHTHGADKPFYRKTAEEYVATRIEDLN